MVVMYLLPLVRLLKSNCFDIVEECVNSKIVPQHNDYKTTTIEVAGIFYQLPPTGSLSEPINPIHVETFISYPDRALSR